MRARVDLHQGQSKWFKGQAHPSSRTKSTAHVGSQLLFRDDSILQMVPFDRAVSKPCANLAPLGRIDADDVPRAVQIHACNHDDFAVGSRMVALDTHIGQFAYAAVTLHAARGLMVL